MQCKSSFSVGAEDLAWYKKFDVCVPRLCPRCRAQRRLAFRNERSFYKRPCDKCKKAVVSMYSPNKPYPVWCYECWFADDWDAAVYGKDYDPTRPFLEQVDEVYKSVPKVALIYVRSVNSEYVNISADNKNCYMLVESSNNEGCSHSYWVQQCRDSVDLSYSHQTELTYESDDCYNSYRILYSKSCHNCRDAAFLEDCRGVSDSVACVNLRNKQYCAFNKQLSKGEYAQLLAEARMDTAQGVEAMRKKYAAFLAREPRKYAEIVNAPCSSGNYMKDAKNCRECFHCYEAEDCKYGEHVWRNAKDCVDVSTAGRNANMIYNSINAGIDVAHYVAVAQGWSSTFLEYCLNCFNSNHCLGSAGLRKKDYCILNKQYSKEAFDALREKIIEGMRGSKEYGEFFPARFSPFGYNETVAQEQYPLRKDDAEKLGFSWEEYPRGTFGKETIAWEHVPDSIHDVRVDVAKEIFPCTACTKNFRIIQSEYQFYKNMAVPLPRFCPDCRHARRMRARGPNRLWSRACRCAGALSEKGVYANSSSHFHGEEKCPNVFESPYAPERDEIVYCEACYNAEVA